ncbi:hypothetical protein Ait01nite_039170 [Actinoplanes italicus]|uniref:Uncharacterized protein n=1 Tax=Actinoplanes italicus TaxID=113567 RepID=A0A2T0JX48_9ACTN|nr:hypothetical protein [Actinoplanes italicus]PRX12057.1 hypothetical protein CLV67_13082 [Actinoplanes italicus]GIE30872.1 hypothetical protein Ait01nite_039170 [Actinoplanes italicus]
MGHGTTRLIAVPMMLLVAALGGCTGDGGGTGAAPTGGGASAAPDEAAQGRKFAQCMRAEGIDMPDPGADGMAGIPGLAVGDEAGAKKMDAAMEKCRDLLPDGGEPPKASAEDIAKAREYAKCVRENGVPGFPDPDAETGLFRMDPDQADDLGDLEKASKNCQQFGSGMMPGITVGR